MGHSETLIVAGPALLTEQPRVRPELTLQKAELNSTENL